jgi:hypothetical protein
LHDGGVNVNIYKNNSVICDSRAKYTMGGGHGGPDNIDGGHAAVSAPAPGAKRITRRDGGPHSTSDGKAHINVMTTCSNLGPIKKGDAVHIDANYDFNKFEGMKSKAGAYTEIMGIAIMYAAANPPEMSAAASPVPAVPAL